MRNTEIHPILKQLLNEDPVLLLAHHNSIMTKQAVAVCETDVSLKQAVAVCETDVSLKQAVAVCETDISSVKQANESTITYWHQDIRYWNYENDNLLSVWLSLGDEFLENGLLEFIPGSYKMNFTNEQFDERLSFKEDSKKNRDILNKRVHTKLEKRGHCSLSRQGSSLCL